MVKFNLCILKVGEISFVKFNVLCKEDVKMCIKKDASKSSWSIIDLLLKIIENRKSK